MDISPNFSSASFIPISNRKGIEKDHRVTKNKFRDSDEQNSDEQNSTYDSGLNIMPWKRRPSYCGVIGLHEEIEDFYETMRPAEQETDIRLRVVEHITRIVHSLWPQARVEVFGSFRTGLYLPSSDIDLVVLGEWSTLPLYTLGKALEKNGIASEDISVVPNASVPIIRLVHTQSKLRVDISFNKENGVQAAKLIKDLMKQYPPLPKLVLVLKQFLLHRGLNEVYSGGLSSYCLTLLITSLLQGFHKPTSLPSSNLGTLLMEFFEHYGINFNYKKVSIHFHNGGSYKPRYRQNDSFLSVEDPLMEGNDLAKGSYLMNMLKIAFQNAFLCLHKAVSHSTMTNTPSPGFLNLILNVSDDVLQQRQWMISNYSAILRSLTSITEISCEVPTVSSKSPGKNKKKKKIR